MEEIDVRRHLANKSPPSSLSWSPMKLVIVDAEKNCFGKSPTDNNGLDSPIDFSLKRSSSPISTDKHTSLPSPSLLRSSPERRQVSPLSVKVEDKTNAERTMNSTPESVVNGNRFGLDSLIYARLGLAMTSSDSVTKTNNLLQQQTSTLNQQQAEALAAAQLQMLMMSETKRCQLLQLQQAMSTRLQQQHHASATTPTNDASSPSPGNFINNNNNYNNGGGGLTSLYDTAVDQRHRRSVTSSDGSGGRAPDGGSRKRSRPSKNISVNADDAADSDDSRSVAMADSGGNRDPSYLERRRKNNEAAKRSRDARRAKEEEVAMKACVLEEENKQLRVELASLKQEIGRLKQLLFLCQIPAGCANTATS